MWRTDLLIDAAEAGVKLRESELAAEQAVHGLDALEEVEWHPLLERALIMADFGVLREQPYPHEWRRKLGRRGRNPGQLAERRDRLRCDLVLTPATNQQLVDPLAVDLELARHRAGAQGTLFTSVASRDIDDLSHQLNDAGVRPEDAYWLEIKVVGQYCYNAGIPGPNHSYGTELRRSLTDLQKLDEDERIRRGGLLLLLLTQSEPVAHHDLTELMHASLDRGFSIASPELRYVPISERIGNHVCTLCLIDLRKSSLPGDDAPR